MFQKFLFATFDMASAKHGLIAYSPRTVDLIPGCTLCGAVNGNAIDEDAD